MCNFRTVLVGSSGNIESSSSSLLLSFLHTVSSPFLTDVIFLCTLSAAHPLLQMRPLAASNKLVLYVSMNTTNLLTTHTVSCWSCTQVSHALIDLPLLHFSVVFFTAPSPYTVSFSQDIAKATFTHSAKSNVTLIKEMGRQRGRSPAWILA